MLPRLILKQLEDLSAHVPVVALLGPRQVGKTTLARQFADNQHALYLDLESPADLARLQDPEAFFELHRDKLIVLDEIQRVPDLFAIIRGQVDQGRRCGRRGAQFLVLGSASMDLLRQSAESLAGRISYLEMTGLNLLEVPHAIPEKRHQLWLRGGFPDSYLAATDDVSLTWREDFIRTYLERDIPQFAHPIPATRLRNLWTMLAHLQGEALNASRLAANLEVTGKTVNHYVDILEGLYLVRRLDPWHANTKKRLVKSPRVYIRDSGLLHRLLGIDDHAVLLAHPVLGKSWEGFVLENLLAVAPRQVQPFYYRTAAGLEIDLLLRISDREIWAVEIKNSTAPVIREAFALACADVGATRKLVVYPGNDSFPARHGTTVLPLHALMEELRGLVQEAQTENNGPDV